MVKSFTGGDAAGPFLRAAIFSARKVGNGTIGLKKIMPATCLGMTLSMDAYMASPAPLPKPRMMTFFQSSSVAASLISMDSTMERPSNSTSCSMSRSSFSKFVRSRMNQLPSVTSTPFRLKSIRPSPAGCWDQEMDRRAALPMEEDKSLRIAFSAGGLSPTQTTRELGFLAPASSVTGNGPSGVVAATLLDVKRRSNHSDFNLSRSSSSFFFELPASAWAAMVLDFSGLPPSSTVFCSSSCKVGKIKTTCALSDASAALEKASLIASSPTLYNTVSSENLFARTSLVRFSRTAIIFFEFAESECTQRLMLKPHRAPPHAASNGGETSIGCATP
mmetsp:Transcript_21237/g.48514  ORF Transcript_21237/g.48514 Transcript_21237/m.48514 type:complete len:333 (-) Transcript_21237:1385-2383(-)